jgi:N-dimethylarginine dimethylaminohydrolase
MKHFLMCVPQFFEVCYVINPWMEGNLGKVDKALAWRQWQKLYDIVAGLASVSLIEPVAGLPDMVFTANAGLVHNKEAIVSSFLHAARQPEAIYFEQFFSVHGYRTHHLKQNTIFEGAGDALFDSHGRLWFGSGIRSDPHALGEIMTVFYVDSVRLELVDPCWYHLDTAFCPLPNGQALAYDKAFSDKSIAALNKIFGADILWISAADASNFACNAVTIDKNIIMHKASAELKAELVERSFKVIETDMSEFLKSGGACKCLTLEI